MHSWHHCISYRIHMNQDMFDLRPALFNRIMYVLCDRMAVLFKRQILVCPDFHLHINFVAKNNWVFKRSTRSTPLVFNAQFLKASSVCSSHALSTILSIASLKISNAAFSINMQITTLARGSMIGNPEVLRHRYRSVRLPMIMHQNDGAMQSVQSLHWNQSSLHNVWYTRTLLLLPGLIRLLRSVPAFPGISDAYSPSSDVLTAGIANTNTCPCKYRSQYNGCHTFHSLVSIRMILI